MDEQSASEIDWRVAWARGGSQLSSDAIGELLDLDLRLSALPAGQLKDKLARWLDDVGGNLVSGSLTPPSRDGSDNGLHPLCMLQAHVLSVVFVYKNLRLAHSSVALLLTYYSSVLPTIPNFASREIAQLWVLVFVAGVSGSATAGLWKIYTQDFRALEASAYMPRPHVGKMHPLGLFLRLTLDEAVRAAVRPVVGGLFAWIITLVLLSGLLLEPLVSNFVTETGVVDTKNVTGVMFFLAIAVVAGFTEGWVISLLERVRSNV